MLKPFLCTFAIGASVVATAAARFDPPDLSLELELHRQFLRQHDGAEAAAPLAKDAYVERYRIQNGETLWSLSQTLYGDGNYWPRVWAQNHGITNPHLIRPGHQLQFLMGSEDDTPAFRFSEDGDESSGVELAAANGNPIIEIPPPEIPPKPVLSVPKSFPEWQNVYREKPKPIIDDRGLEFKRAKVPDRIFLRAYVEEKEIEPVGYFLENDTESGLPVINQYVYIKVNKGTAHVGDRFTIARDAGRVRTVTPDFNNYPRAYLVQVAGELQITESISADFNRSRDREKFDCFRALMTKTTGLSLKGMSLVAGGIPVVDLTPEGPRSEVSAEILGSEKHEASQLYGQGDIVFLNKGASAGIRSGQLMDIFVDRKARYSETPVRFSPARSGFVKVVRTTSLFSTAVILDAHDSIQQGDKVEESQSPHARTEILGDAKIQSVEGGQVKEGDFELIDENEFEKEIDGL